MDRDIKVQNLQSYCRTCLAECNGYKYDVEQLPRAIFQLFKQVTGFRKTHSSLFPKWICNSCCSKIKSFSEFRVMSKKSTQFLEDLMKSYNTPKLAKNIDIENQNEPEDTINQKSVLSQNFSSIEDKIQDLEIPHEKNHFENIFLQTEIKADHFDEAVQQSSNTTDALAITNADNNENTMQDVAWNIKIEEKCNSEENYEDNTCKVFGSTYSTVAGLKAQMNIHQDQHKKDLLDTDANSEESSDENLSLLVKSKNDQSKKTCKFCNKTYVSSTALRSHILSHNETCRFQCDQCNRRFKRKVHLKEHIQEMHGENPMEINCKFNCGKTFLRFQTALAHYRSKHRPKANTILDTKLETGTNEATKTCEERVEQSADSSQLEAETNTLPIINKTTCKICFRNYSSEQKLNVHLRLHEGKRPFQCDQCERCFNEKARLKRHIAESHTNDVTEVACKFGCGKTFRRLETLKKHYYLKHSPPEKQIKAKTYTFVCESCGRIFKNITAMREHSYTHRPAEDRPYKCEECSKSFTSKRSYKDHLTRHSGIKKYECPHCGLKKTTRKELKHHLNIHTKEKVYNCSVCAKDFNRMSGLKLHERVVHQGIRMYKCSYCDQSFGKPDTLKHHVMRHTGERPHKCEKCDRSFIQVVALRAHMKTHNK